MSNNDDIREKVFQKQLESLNWNIKEELQGKTLEEIKKFQPMNNFAIAVVNVEGGLNIGNIMRTAVIYGANEFIVIGKSKYDKRSTVGAHNYIKVTKLPIEKAKDYLFDNYIPVYFDTGFEELTSLRLKHLKSWATFKDNNIPCFVFGSESNGIPMELISKESYKFSLPQYGVLRSFNVSIAAAIVMDRYHNIKIGINSL